ncbi:MAG: galactokinase [Deltaproteobacteria bacterium]|uniref:Galactokinase n=1 Tax=Candidatus Zymogenus saltonus TaxID=2844893 RepID=A0A9D8KGV3_9DELT|nr:galactokinase [Candidatus Zymogenus saltonus]
MDNNIFLLRASFGSIFYTKPKFLASAPGRVNLIGEHTDYNEGFVLPMAIEKRIYVMARPMYGDLVRLKSVGFQGIEEFQVNSKIVKGERGEGNKTNWADYVKGVSLKIKESGRDMNGFWALYRSDIPIGAGLSSSAALEVSTAIVIAAQFGYTLESEEIVAISHSAENDFVGVKCGVMDQMTCVHAKEGNALFIDCRDSSFEYIPMKLKDETFVVVDTRVKRELGSSVYNDRRKECEAAAKAIAKLRPEVKALRDAKLDDLKEIDGKVDANAIKRARHIITENERVIKAVEHLKGGKFKEFGELMYLSHESLKTDYEVSSPELDLVVDTARGVKGVFGARLTGAGLGGSAIVLVKKESLEDLSGAVVEAFAKKELEEPNVFPVSPSGGVTVEEMEVNE